MRTPQCRACLPSLSASQASAVLVSVQSIGDASPPKVFPDSPTDATYGWNSGQHVRLPCSSESRYPSRDQSGLVDRWPLVQAALSRAPEWTRSQDVIVSFLTSIFERAMGLAVSHFRVVFCPCALLVVFFCLGCNSVL